MSEQLSQIFEMMLTLDRKFTTFAQQAGYEFDAEGNAKRVGKPVAVVSAKPKRFNFKQALIDAGACPDESQLFMDARAKKKAVNSEQAYKMFLSSLGNYSVAQAVKICAGEQWKGFKVDWAERLQPEQKKRYGFMELARGDHLPALQAKQANSSMAIGHNPMVSPEFAALEAGIRANN